MTRLPTIAALYAIHAATRLSFALRDLCCNWCRRLGLYVDDPPAFTISVECEACRGVDVESVDPWDLEDCETCGGTGSRRLTPAELAREMRNG